MRFVLVHGGAHCAWCWDRLLYEIDDLGHQAIAMDLPGHGSRVRETSTIAGYRKAVVELLDPGDILVGHSMGAMVATLAADVFQDIAHMVYLAGPAPRNGSTMAAETAVEYVGGSLELDESEQWLTKYMRFTASGDAFYFDLEGATQCLYNDCSPELAAWAHARMTPQCLAVANEPLSLPNFWDLNIPKSYISCRRDRACPPRISSLHAQRLGCPTWELDTSHSPFLSKPRELAELLIKIATPTLSDARPTVSHITDRSGPAPSAGSSRAGGRVHGDPVTKSGEPSVK